jgi:cation diffusion facilitator CzcD-associated flavoprotein CzcO
MARYKTPDEYKDKRVLIVGTGDSGLDCCVDLSRNIANKTYITGRGIYVYPCQSVKSG